MSFKAGDVLGVDGAEGEHVFLIAQGQVAMLKSAQDLGTSDADDAEVSDLIEETLGGSPSPSCQCYRLQHRAPEYVSAECNNLHNHLSIKHVKLDASAMVTKLTVQVWLRSLP